MDILERLIDDPSFAMINHSNLFFGVVGGYNEYAISSLQTLKEIKQSFAIEMVYSFNVETNTLYFNGDDVNNGDTIVMMANVREDETKLYKNELFRKLIKASLLRQWVINLSIKYNQNEANIIGNGLRLNVDFMDEFAQRLEDEIKEEIEEMQYGEVLMIQRLYN